MGKTALLIGRFQPFHLGHLNLIKRYSRAGFFIKIAIGSSQREFEKDNPLSSQERKEIINRVMKEEHIHKYKIFHIPDINNDADYVRHVIKILGRFDIILTGNPKVLKLFKDFKTAKPWNIESFEESNRPGGQISASKIRKNWLIKPSKKGLSDSTFDYLNSIDFANRLRKINKK